MFQGLSAFVGGFHLASEYHGDLALRIEPDDHVRALVRGPDVVILVDSHRVREGPGVQVVTNLTNEFSIGGKLKQLRGACGIGGARGITTREDEDVSLGIYGHAGDFTEIQIFGKLQQIGNRIKRNFRSRRLSEQPHWRNHKNRERERKAFHRKFLQCSFLDHSMVENCGENISIPSANANGKTDTNKASGLRSCSRWGLCVLCVYLLAFMLSRPILLASQQQRNQRDVAATPHKARARHLV